MRPHVFLLAALLGAPACTGASSAAPPAVTGDAGSTDGADSADDGRAEGTDGTESGTSDGASGADHADATCGPLPTPTAWSSWVMPNPAESSLPNPASYTVTASGNQVTDNVTG